MPRHRATRSFGSASTLGVEPGQVQSFVRPGTTNGTHLLFTSAFSPHTSSADRRVKEWYGPGCRRLGARPEYAAPSTLPGQLRAEYGRPGRRRPSRSSNSFWAPCCCSPPAAPPDSGGDPQAGGEVYAHFRAELERSYATTRRAADYAHRLGCTVKTLTRAYAAATGRPVKHVIDARVALESPTPTSR